MTDSAPTIATPRTIPPNLIFILTAGVFAMASSSIFIRYAQQEGVPSLLIGAARLCIATIFLTPFVWRSHRPALADLKRTDVLWGVTAGLFLALHFAAWISSLEYTSVLVSTVVVTASPIWVAVLEFLFLRQRPTRIGLIGLAVAIAGGVVIAVGSGGSASEVGSNPLLGLLLAMLGSFAVAAYITVGRKLRAQLPVIPYIWLVYGCASVFMLVFVASASIPILGYPAIAYVWLLCCAIFPQLIGHSSLNYAVGYMPATFVSMITQLEPIGSAILAFLLFQEVPLPIQILGSVLVLVGVMIASVAPSLSARRNRNE